jgi:hypothetical protein
MATSPSPSLSARPSLAEPPTRPNRRRQRSVRVTVAVVLLSIATGAVLLALPTQSPIWLSVAAVGSLLCGWAAARIVYTELVQSRADNAADRAAQATAYRSLFAERADEHAEFTTAMTDRLATRDREVAELQTGLVSAQQRAAEAEARVQREARRATDAEQRSTELEERATTAEERAAGLDTRVAELEAALQQVAERRDELAGWEGFESLQGDLMAWEKMSEAVTAAQRAGQASRPA